MKRIIFLTILFVLCSCTEDLTEAVVVGKDYKKPWQQTIIIPINNGSFTTYVPQIIYHDAEYILIVKGRNEDGEVKTQKWYVREGSWYSYEIGDPITKE